MTDWYPPDTTPVTAAPGVILAIDPGCERSAWIIFGGPVETPANRSIEPNADLLDRLRRKRGAIAWAAVVVIEKIESYGMAVGAEVFETVHWAGRFTEAAQPLPVVQLPRRAVKLALCGSARAKDTNIRQALLDRFGGKAAVGTKAHPGPLYGIHGDLWAALAVAVTYCDLHVGGGG